MPRVYLSVSKSNSAANVEWALGEIRKLGHTPCLPIGFGTSGEETIRPEEYDYLFVLPPDFYSYSNSKLYDQFRRGDVPVGNYQKYDIKKWASVKGGERIYILCNDFYQLKGGTFLLKAECFKDIPDNMEEDSLLCAAYLETDYQQYLRFLNINNVLDVRTSNERIKDLGYDFDKDKNNLLGKDMVNSVPKTAWVLSCDTSDAIASKTNLSDLYRDLCSDDKPLEKDIIDEINDVNIVGKVTVDSFKTVSFHSAWESDVKPMLATSLL